MAGKGRIDVEYVIETGDAEVAYEAADVVDFTQPEHGLVHVTLVDGSVDVWENVVRWYLLEAWS